MSHNEGSLIYWIEKLTGGALSPLPHVVDTAELFTRGGMGYSQLNEYMLGVQANRVSEGFFSFVFKSNTIGTFEHFRNSIIDYRKLAMLRYGSFLHAFYVLANKSQDAIELEFVEFKKRSPVAFKERHHPLAS
jgi:hypothetical protein